MGTRSKTLQWLKAKQGELQEPICTSTLFNAKESWTNRKTWWICKP